MDDFQWDDKAPLKNKIKMWQQTDSEVGPIIYGPEGWIEEFVDELIEALVKARRRDD